jgi:hypothetical protein
MYYKFTKIELTKITYYNMLLDIAIYIASIFPESWYGLTLIHREFAEYAYSRAGILKYRKLFTKVEIKDGDKSYRIFGKLNSIEDKPAIIRANGDKYWYINDKRHRENDQPVIIGANGTKYWYINDNIHRDDDQPAIIWADGDKEWYINGNRHRENDQPAGRNSPAIIRTDGTKRWYFFNNKFIKIIF